jgi:hypothetical protein
MLMLSVKKTLKDEAGFASIVIALILIIILGLFCVGFAQLARHEQQSALSKQLANQAYDAAESGINDAFQDIQNGYITSLNESPTTCMNVTNTNAKTHYPIIDANHDVAYTCLLVNVTPESLHFNVPDSESYVIPFSTTQPLGALSITWNSLSGHFDQPPDTSTGFPPSATWNSQGFRPVLQVGITPLANGINLSRQGIINNSFTTIAYPNNATTTLNDHVAYYPDTVANSQAPITGAYCGNVYDCTMSISNLQTAPGSSGPGSYYYLLRVTSLYDRAGIQINGDDETGQPVEFHNSQALIDVTGKARYVVKRLQAYVPLNEESNLPQAALEGQNICKQFQTDPIDGTTGYPVTEAC